MRTFVTSAVAALLLLSSTAKHMEGLVHAQEPRISEISVFGNQVINRSSIIATSGLVAGETLAQDRLFHAKKRILATGYFGAGLMDQDAGVKVEAEVTEANARIVITVVENEVVRGFEITGSGPIPPVDILKVLEPLKGILNLHTLQRKVGEIRALYEGAGYQGFVNEDLAVRDGILKVPMTVGRVGAIHIDGLHPDITLFLLALIRTKPNSYYNFNDLRKDLLLLRALGLEEVNFGYHDNSLRLTGIWLRVKDPPSIPRRRSR